MAKLKIGVMYGGRSAEHEVSLNSAKNVIAALDPEKYQVTEIFVPREAGMPDMALVRAQDVIFPVLHGPFGEDGTVQGLLKLAGVPYVGPGVLGSAVGMDKDVMKRLWRDAGLPIGRFHSVHAHEREGASFENISKDLGLPLFVKPANLGSSVGISKAKNKVEFDAALELAFGFDRKVIIEEFIEGREIECAVLGNEHPEASVPGEIVPTHEFYSYEAKYTDAQGALLKIPADLEPAVAEKIRLLAVQAFQTLECEGMSRVDFFLTPDGRPILNEINTIPGFTNISMYPKLWEASGLPYAALVDRLIELALQRSDKERSFRTTRA